MDDSVTALLIIIVIIGLGWLIPLLSILFSKKTSGSEKVVWILAVLLFSWLAWIFYLLLAPINMSDHEDRKLGYYVNLGVGLGSVLGVVFGAAFGSARIWVLYGPAIGALLGLIVGMILFTTKRLDNDVQQ